MRRFRTTLAVLAAVALAACGNDDAPAPSAAQPAGPSSFKVMTQNLYLGADIDLLASSTNLLTTVEQLWASMLATDFPARAQVIADAIQAADADVVGLQEVSLWRSQTPGDHLPIPNATTVAVDFLDVLVRALEAKGLSYRVVGTVTNADLELPGATGTDYRMTDRDAIIAKSTFPIGAGTSGTFAHLASLSVPNPLPGQPAIQLTIRRGWVAADLRAGGKTVTVFNTHLEAVSPDIATQQAQDLLALASPGARPTVILGDINLTPDSPGYGLFVAPATRLRDAWREVNGGDAGVTCCWAPDLRGGSLSTRIDVVFATTDLRPTAAARLNESARTPSGLSPSDHLGVTATLEASTASSTVASAR